MFDDFVRRNQVEDAVRQNLGIDYFCQGYVFPHVYRWWQDERNVPLRR